jgi:hypothetical protein
MAGDRRARAGGVLIVRYRVPAFIRNPRVLLPTLTVVSIVALAGGARLIFDNWLVPVIVALTIVLVVLLVALLWMQYTRQRKERIERGTEDEHDTSEKDTRAAERASLVALEEGFRRGSSAFKATPKGIYEIPWYLVVGEQQSGKSKLVATSGLDLPAKFAGMIGTGPTSHCDWWITNEAVLLDTAGRYLDATDESVRKEWRKLLGLLRKARPRRPINGLILAVPVTQILGRNSTDLIESAKEIRRRINELTDILGVDAPIYIVVTKADRLDGFLETARVLPQPRLPEVLGWTNPERRFPNAEEAVRRGLTEACDRLDGFLPELLMREGDPFRRTKLFLFPQALEEAADALAIFLGQLFQRSISEETPFLRGIYLTSSVQAGETLSPLLERLRHGWARTTVEEHEGTGAIFLRDLFQEIIVDVEEAGLARRSSRLGPVATRILLGAGVLASVSAIALWGNSFRLNWSAIGKLSDDSASVLAAAPSLPTIDRLRTTIETEDENRQAFFHRVWLGGPTQVALDRAHTTFNWAFRREFEEPAKANLLGTLRELGNRAFGALADLALDLTWLRTRTEADAGLRPQLWRYAAVRGNPVDTKSFTASYDALVRWLPEPEIERKIERERDALERVAAALLALPRLEEWAQQSVDTHPPTRYSDVGVPEPAGEVVTSVSAPYTRQVWESLVRALVHGVEMTGGASGSAVDRFRHDYVERYDQQWRQYLINTPLPAVADPEVRSSPYLKLTEQIDDNTRADLPRDGAEPPWVLSLRETRRTEASEGEEAGPPWPRYEAALEQVGADVASFRHSPEDALDLAVRAGRKEPTSFGKALAVVEEIVPSESDPRAAAKLREVLAMPILNGFSAVLEQAVLELDRRWFERIASGFSGSLTEASLRALYAPAGGELSRFRSEFLDAFYTDGQARTLLGDRTLPFGPNFLNWIEGSAVIQRALFPGAGGMPRIAVRLQGVPSQVTGRPGLYVARRELRVVCADRVDRFVYREGTGTHTFSWTPDCQEVSFRIWVRDQSGQEREVLPRGEWNGPLAFAKFLQSARRVGPQSLLWRLPYPEAGAEIALEYRIRGGHEILAIAHRPPPRSVGS